MVKQGSRAAAPAAPVKPPSRQGACRPDQKAVARIFLRVPRPKREAEPVPAPAADRRSFRSRACPKLTARFPRHRRKLAPAVPAGTEDGSAAVEDPDARPAAKARRSAASDRPARQPRRPLPQPRRRRPRHRLAAPIAATAAAPAAPKPRRSSPRRRTVPAAPPRAAGQANPARMPPDCPHGRQGFRYGAGRRPPPGRTAAIAAPPGAMQPASAEADAPPQPRSRNRKPAWTRGPRSLKPIDVARPRSTRSNPSRSAPRICSARRRPPSAEVVGSMTKRARRTRRSPAPSRAAQGDATKQRNIRAEERKSPRDDRRRHRRWQGRSARRGRTPRRSNIAEKSSRSSSRPSSRRKGKVPIEPPITVRSLSEALGIRSVRIAVQAERPRRARQPHHQFGHRRRHGRVDRPRIRLRAGDQARRRRRGGIRRRRSSSRTTRKTWCRVPRSSRSWATSITAKRRCSTRFAAATSSPPRRAASRR